MDGYIAYDKMSRIINDLDEMKNNDAFFEEESNHDDKQLEQLEILLVLIEDTRYLAAFKMYDELIEGKSSSSKTHALNTWLATHALPISKMLERVNSINKALADELDSSDWLFGALLYGIKTYYRKCADDNLFIKMEGILTDLPLFEQTAVIHEIDLFKLWVPFCTESLHIDKQGNTDLVGDNKLIITVVLQRS